MRRYEIKNPVFMLVIFVLFLCSCASVSLDQEEETEVMCTIESEEKGESEDESILETIEASNQSIDENELMQKNREEFYETGKENNLSDEELEAHYSRLLQDNIFQDGTLQLNACILSDVDKNGQMDMVIMVAEEQGISATGYIYIYLNEAEPYCFQGEVCCGIGFWEWNAGDIDNDGNIELIMEVSNGGNGGPGGREVVILKYKNDTFEEMELPEDMGEKYDWGIDVWVNIDYIENTYNASCPLLGEISRNYLSRKDSARERDSVIALNLREFYDYKCVEYNGRNALQCSEYLYGDRGNADGVGTAEFILVWDEEGNCSVDKWWIKVW